MLTLKYIFGCLIGYFLSLFLFFTTEFVSYPQLDQISNKTLTQSIKESSNFPKKSKSKYQEPQDNQQQLILSEFSQNSQQAIPAPKVSQVILIIIDALRYDYITRMRFFNQTLTKHPQTSLLKKSVVGNPTMTTQRIQSIMTGSQIFTQTNILDMFVSQKKKTDNLIDQLKRTNKTVKVFGDDTWVKLFEFGKGSQFVCDSTFNIRDYDRCDELIYENLHKFVKIDKVDATNIKNENQSDKGDNKMNKNKDKPDKGDDMNNQNNKNQQYSRNDSLLIAHFLALDHIGHSTSSIKSPQMSQKMQRMSLYFQYLLNIASQDTIFIITGDHGMREDGNHGGNSPVERESLFFAYYQPIDQKTRQKDFERRVNNQKPKHQNTRQTNFQKRVNNFKGGFVSQVDITATISVLLDVPNPINSIGCPIIEILPQQFRPYLARILYKTLDQYKLLIKHYSKESEAKSISTKLNKCLDKIISKQNQLDQLTQEKQTFQQLMKSKQFIKTQIQMGECLGERLSMVEPDLFTVWMSLIIMAWSFVLLVGRGVYCELQLLANLDQTQRLFPFVIEVIGWVGSLFVIYFSWYLIRNSSTYLVLLIIGMTVMIPKMGINLGKKVELVFLILLLTQFQPDKINQYQLNYFNLNILENIVAFLNSQIPTSPSAHSHLSQQNKQIQLRQLKTLLHVFCLTVWVMVRLKRSMSWMRKLNKKRGKIQQKIQDSRSTIQQRTQDTISTIEQRTQDTRSTNKLLQTVIIVLAYFILFSEGLSGNSELIGSSGSKGLVKQVDILQLVVYMRSLVLLLILIKWVKQSLDYDLIQKQSQQVIRSTDKDRDFNIFITFSIVVGLQNFLPLILFTKIIGTIINHNLSSHHKPSNLITKSQKISYKHDSINKNQPNQLFTIGSRIILIALVSQYMWWILGNRYEYSSIDIRKSYLLSVSFNVYLNAIAMVLWFMAPYIIAVAIIDTKIQESTYLSHYQQPINQQQKRDVQQQEQSLNVINSSASNILEQSQKNIRVNQLHFRNTKLDVPNRKLDLPKRKLDLLNTKIPNSLRQLSIIKFMFVFMAGLLSAAVNLVFNNNKILFTIVYVPLLVFGMLKVFIIGLLVAILLLYRIKWIK